jgi:hypothetical protein
LAYEIKDEIDQDKGVDDSVDPRHYQARKFVFGVLPPGERYISGDIYIEQQRQYQQQPSVFHPDAECNPE